MITYPEVKQDLIDSFGHFERLLDKSSAPQNTIERVQYTLIAAGIQITLAFIASYIILAINSLLSTPAENAISDFVGDTKTLKTFIIIALIGPLLEEGLFRIWLGRIAYIAPIIFGGIYLFLAFDTDTSKVYDLISIENVFLFIVIVIPVIFCVTQLLRKKWYFSPNTQQLKTLLWITTIAFGLFHIPNYVHGDFSFWLALLLSPILLAPQLIGGYIFGICRIRAGFIYAILAHCLNNSVFAIGLFLTY